MWTRCGRGINTGNMDIEVTWRRARGGDAGRIDQVFDNEIMPLIVAAPEMLAALRAVMAWAKTPGNHGGNPYAKRFVQQAEEAIARAEGRE